MNLHPHLTGTQRPFRNETKARHGMNASTDRRCVLSVWAPLRRVTRGIMAMTSVPHRPKSMHRDRERPESLFHVHFFDFPSGSLLRRRFIFTATHAAHSFPRRQALIMFCAEGGSGRNAAQNHFEPPWGCRLESLSRSQACPKGNSDGRWRGESGARLRYERLAQRTPDSPRQRPFLPVSYSFAIYLT